MIITVMFKLCQCHSACHSGYYRYVVLQVLLSLAVAMAVSLAVALENLASLSEFTASGTGTAT